MAGWLSLHQEPVKAGWLHQTLNRAGNTLTLISHNNCTGNPQRRLGSSRLGSSTGGLNKTGTGALSDQASRQHTGRSTHIKKGMFSGSGKDGKLDSWFLFDS